MKHISSPLERDNAWLHVTAHRAAVESPELIAAIGRKLGGRLGISQVSPDKRAECSTWAEMPWVSRATAIRPDSPDLASDDGNVKTVARCLLSCRAECLFLTKRTFRDRVPMSAFGG